MPTLVGGKVGAPPGTIVVPPRTVIPPPPIFRPSAFVGVTVAGAQFQQGDNRFESDRLKINIIKTDPDVAIGQFVKKSAMPLKLITFFTAKEPDDNIRLGKPNRRDRMYTRSSTSLIQLIDPNMPPEFLDPKIAIVSYRGSGTAPQIEVGDEFLGWTSPHAVWRVVDDFATAINERNEGQRVQNLVVSNRVPLRFQRLASLFVR